MSSPFYPKRSFINIAVKNDGRGIAENCQVKSRLLSKTNGCQWLSYEEKGLTWSDITAKTTIVAKGDKGIFHLVFSQQLLADHQWDKISSLECGIAKEKVHVITWVGTKKALEEPEYRDHDGLCQGQYIVHIDVFSEDGYRVYKHFVIVVGDNWHDLGVQMTDCQCMGKPSLFRKFLTLFSRNRQ